uniref:Complement factor H n=2 Tax=Xenopus tropicalis TaxID=8364 RepID=A0A803JPN9_XENTR
MSLTGYLQVYITALCCIAIGAQAPCDRPERTAEEELQGTWDKDSYNHGTIASYICRPGYSRLGAIKKQCDNGKWIYLARGLCKKKSCGHPGDIPNGSFELDGENEFVFGVIVTYSCDSGYHMVSKVTTRTCTANGWSNFLPNCEAKNCPPVELTEGVEIVSSYDDEYTVGKVIRFQCKNPKFKLNGVAEIFCTSEGDWNAPPPECEEIKCSAPVLPNGRINARKETYYLDDKLLYVCNGNYKKERSIDPVCTKNGWAPEPTCNEITCTADYVPNGSVKNKKIMYRLGDTIELECKYGFVLDKPDEPRICTLNGWSLPLTCVDKICDRPFIQNGRLYSEMNFPSRRNTELWYICNDNFDPLDKIYYSWSRRYYGKSICTENGWDPKPKCFALCWDSSARVDYADIYHTKRRYMEGERVKFQCYGDRRTEDGRNGGDIECLPNHKFSEARCLKSCMIESVSHGRYIPNKKMFEHGESLVYECDEGYRSTKNTRFDSATCPWTSPPRCVETTCHIEELNEEYKAGDVVQFACSRGYELVGQEVSQCYYYGWSPELPTCRDDYSGQVNRYRLITKKQVDLSVCAPAPKPPRSQDSEIGNITYHNDSTVEIRCASQYRALGSKSIKCENGKWQSPPQCIEFGYCNQPPIIENGNITTEKQYYSNGDVVKYQCNPGYEISGSSESLCFSQQWTGPPVCKGKSCDQPPDIENAVVSGLKQQYKHGESAKYTCQAGYTISEDVQAKCVEGKWRNVPKCLSTSCESAPEISNAVLLNKKNNYNSGDRAFFRCNTGYVFNMGQNSAICKNSQWKELPECRREGQSCGPPPVVQFGDTLQTREPNNKHGTKMTYKCPEYYILEGNTEVVCRNGKWDDPPICIEPCTVSERDLKANNIQLKWTSDKKLYSRHSEWIGFTCLDGYEISEEKLLRIQCNRSVLPYPKCIKRGSCLLSLTVMEENNVFVNGSTEIEDGKTVTFLCKEGWIPTDTLTQECVKREIKYPNCSRAGNCTFPDKITDGNVIIEAQDGKSFFSGSSLKVKCREGFATVGPPFITCNNSKWINLPMCARQCQVSLPELETNHLKLESANDVDGIYTHGNKLNVQCKSGYSSKQKAPLRASCTNGNFMYPQCSQTSSCTISINDLGENKIELLRPYDANKEYPHGTQFRVKCQTNYVLPPQKQRTATCDNGNINYPKCYSINRCRISQEQLDENDLELDSKDEDSVYFEDGELIQFNCKTGFISSTGTVGLCAKTQITYPRCTEPRSCTISINDPGKNKLDLLRPNDISKEYPHGTQFQFKCKASYVLPPQKQLNAICDNGNINYPRCYSINRCRISQEQLDENVLELDSDDEYLVYYEDGELIQFKCKAGFISSTGTVGLCAKTQITYPRCTEA